jgi:hypothetical protein
MLLRNVTKLDRKSKIVALVCSVLTHASFFAIYRPNFFRGSSSRSCCEGIQGQKRQQTLWRPTEKRWGNLRVCKKLFQWIKSHIFHVAAQNNAKYGVSGRQPGSSTLPRQLQVIPNLKFQTYNPSRRIFAKQCPDQIRPQSHQKLFFQFLRRSKKKNKP